MKWFSIWDYKTDSMVGIMIESETGQLVAAALSGDMEKTDSCFRIISEIMRRDELVFVAREGLQFVSRVVSKGEPGYVRAVVNAVQPPLFPGKHGIVQKVGSPADMVNRIWIALGADAPPPPLMAGGEQTRRVDKRLRQLYPAR